MTRRTQAQRSEQARQLILDSALISLLESGYKDTSYGTISRIAGISRSTLQHHFATRTALIGAAAQHLMRRIYQRLEHSMASLETLEQGRVETFVRLCWSEVISQADQLVLNELLAASIHDLELANELKSVWNEGHRILGQGAVRFLARRSDVGDPQQLMVLTQWLLRGMSQDKHLVDSPQVIEHYLTLWCRVLDVHIGTPPGLLPASTR